MCLLNKPRNSEWKMLKEGGQTDASWGAGGVERSEMGKAVRQVKSLRTMS